MQSARLQLAIMDKVYSSVETSLKKQKLSLQHKTGKLLALRRTHCSDKLLRLQLSNCGTTARHNPFVGRAPARFVTAAAVTRVFAPSPLPLRPPPKSHREGGGVNWKTVYIQTPQLAGLS